MKKILSTMVLCCAVAIGHAQVLNIVDSESGDKLDQVSLMNKTPNTFATTNAKGMVDITPFKGAERIEVIYLGYEKQVFSYQELIGLNDTLKLLRLSFSTDAIVVSSSRWKQNVRDIPFKVTAISRIDVELQNPQSAADLLAGSGEIFVQKSQYGGGSPMIRGFATNRLLYSIDGVRMNTAIFRGGNLQNVISLDPFAIENTEVLFGPGSVIYGSDAIGGVMSFQTLKPSLSLDGDPYVAGKAISRISSASNELSAHFDVNVGWKKWAMITSFTSNDYGDLKMGSNGPDEYLRPYYVGRVDNVDVVVNNDDPRIQSPSGYDQINFMQKVRFQPNQNWDINYGFHYSETSPYSRYDRHLRVKDGLPRYGEWNYGPQKWMMNNISIEHDGSTVMYDQMNIRLAHQYFEESRISRDFNDATREIRMDKVDAYSANVDFNKSFGKRDQLIYGFEFVQNDIRSSGIDENVLTGASQVGPARYPQATWASYAVYISDQYKINEKFLVQGGLRYNVFQMDAQFDTSFYPFPYTEAKLNEGALTGSVGAVYRPNNSWVISANAATGYRSPNVDDMGKVFDSEPGAVVVPNPDLKAEYAYNFDLGITKVLGGFAKVDATVFYTYLDNALVRRDFTLNGMDSIVYAGDMSKVQAIQNAAVANVYGIQLGIEIMFGAGFGFSSKFNYQVGEEELDDGSVSPSRHAAPMFGVSRLFYKRGKLNLQFYAEYSGGRSYEELPITEQAKPEIYAIDDNGNPYSPEWYTVNFKAMYQISDHFTVNAGLENITDQLYRSYSSGISAAGRNFILSLKATF
ncbi:TonB-dependent receptor plug domain-containing protein [Crocinitomix catalasitica]|uniref:TonB-dependent receptor plug domain-containing protein n=1 Tax=Crocinitomix catalasitica TaxID=184607 RepID=UPI000488F75F|nr:TonB-dependent receptor [Crocinitomix catalasitica]